MDRIRIVVIFGGMSSEHEISCLSAAAVAEHLDAARYEVLKIGITKEGRWLMYPGGESRMRDGSWETCDGCVPAFVCPDRTTRGIVAGRGGALDVIRPDVVFPVLHGRYGEDGAVQGLLELAGIPYVGCGVLASAAAMDKACANRLFEAHGLPHTPWMAVNCGDMSDFESVLFRMREVMDYPVVVKPSVGGSSIGVSLVRDDEELRRAVLLASEHDRLVLLEKAVEGREVECAVMGNGDVLCTLPGEIEPCNETYDYEAKYHSGDASRQYIPARLPRDKLAEVRALAERAYRALGCEGFARVDFFVRAGDGKVLLSEINTIPGFTGISMFPKLMADAGLPFGAVLDRLVELARERCVP